MRKEAIECTEIIMESGHEGSSETKRGKGKKTEKGRRIWTKKEEETLMIAMKDIVAEGWKSDNGFRAGYIKNLEGKFKKHLPGTDLKGYPHINSKLQTWKKNYYSLTTILNHSGVGFNSDGTFTVNCENTVWDELVRADSNASTIKDKSWPLYDEWKEIFGKDRATGEHAEDILDAVNDLEREYAAIDETYTPGDYHVSLDDIQCPDTGEQSTCQTQGSTLLPKTNVKKRKTSNDAIETVCALLNEISRSTNDKLEALASRVGYDQEMGKARMKIYSSLDKLQGLSMDDKLKFCDILAASVEKLEVFMGLPESARARYVSLHLNSI